MAGFLRGLMPIRTVTLEELRPSVALGPEHFTAQFPGYFLLALGLLDARQLDGEEIPKRSRTREWQIAEDTLTLDFGDRLRHGTAPHPLAGRAYYLRSVEEGRTLILGRLGRCDLHVPDSSVSERHCGVRLENGTLVITDLNSTNGTWSNLHLLLPGLPSQVLDEGLLTVGRYSFQFFWAASMCRALQLLGM